MARSDFPDPYDRVRWRGGKCDRIDKVAIQVWEQQLNATATIFQLGYNPGGVAASAGAHDKGNVADLWFPTVDTIHAVKVGRRIGWANWWRHPPLFPTHIHAVLIGGLHLAPVAAAQVPEYYDGGDGLIGTAVDEIPYRPQPQPKFTIDDYYTELQRRARQDRLTTRLRRLGRDIKHLTRRKRKVRRQLKKLHH